MDTDGDGLADGWEDAGCVDLDCNGSCADAEDIPLPGANRLVRDVYVRYDYMVATTTNDVGTPPHSHEPPAAALDQIKQAFTAHGIVLHFIAPPGSIPEHRVATLDPAPATACAGTDVVTMHELRAQAFATYAAALGPALQHPAYHYLVFAHNAVLPDTGSNLACPADRECASSPDPFNSGSSEIFGDDMIVAFGADLDQGYPLGIQRIAGTTMHELGHNLGLEHGSLADVAPQTCLTEKPNYVSVMGYLYQNGIHVATAPGSTQGMLCDSDADCATGVCATPGACHCTSDLAPANSCYRVDYEADHLLDLDEAHLDETVGVGGPAGDQDIVWFLADSALAFGGAHGPINWNQRNDIETDVAMDLDNDNGTPNTILKTTTDWDKLQLAFQCSSSWGAGAGTGPRPPSAIEPGLLALRARHVAYSPLSVRIDVRPGAASNWIAVGGAGNVPVAIYGSPRLAVSTIDQASLALDAVPAVAARTFDVDGDGHDDLIIDFPMASLPVTATSTRLTLTGWQTSSRMLSGSDVIVPVASAGPGPARR